MTNQQTRMFKLVASDGGTVQTFDVNKYRVGDGYEAAARRAQAAAAKARIAWEQNCVEANYWGLKVIALSLLLVAFLSSTAQAHPHGQRQCHKHGAYTTHCH